MCGIAGLIDHRPIAARRRGRVAAMLDALVHRGPDDSGLFDGDGATLGARRLRVIDLEGGHQPIGNEDGSLWVAYNGEIYNHARLRAELERRGHWFRTRCDTEVVVHAWEEWGEAAPSHFQGMFAFAVWNARTRTAWLVRDRLGVKPLYYATTPHGMAFASEIKGILAAEVIQPEVNLQSLYHYIGYEFVPAPETMFRGIRKLHPGSMLRISGDGVEESQYWNVTFQPEEMSADECAGELRRLVREAVEKRLMADVPLGVFLSGGLDSTAVLACASQASARRLSTFTIGYREASFSEWPYARHAAHHFGSDHHEIVIDPITPGLIEDVVWHLDEPMTDLSAIPFYILSRQAREFATVCLSGEGNDEVFVGYDRFVASKIDAVAYRRLPAVLRRSVIEPLAARLPDTAQKKGVVNLLKRFVEGAALPDDALHLRWQYFSSAERDRRLFAPSLLAQVAADGFAPLRRAMTAAPRGDRLARERYADLRFTMPDSVLMKVDKMSMAHALEVRVPFLDHALVEFAARIPSHLAFPRLRTKNIYRQAMRGLVPDFILERGKQGYSLPLKHWLRGALRPFVTATLERSPLIREHFQLSYVRQLLDEHQRGSHNHNHTIWALLNAALWHRRFVMGQHESGRQGGDAVVRRNDAAGVV
jgi:asparagine synthase (glutamine-hydrolysing)